MARLAENRTENKVHELGSGKQNKVSQIKLASLEPQITSCQVREEKIIIFLEDGREISTPVQLLTKWGILDSEVKPEQLKNYELRNNGRIIYFADIDDVLPTRKIIKGLHTC